MRRIALILLMALLPLQSIWAAAAPACPHESVSAGDHAAGPAHDHAPAQAHVHDRADDAARANTDGAAASDGNPGKPTGSSCHGQGHVAVLADALGAKTMPAAGIVPSPYARFVADRFLESPLRPPVPQHA